MYKLHSFKAKWVSTTGPVEQWNIFLHISTRIGPVPVVLQWYLINLHKPRKGERFSAVIQIPHTDTDFLGLLQ